jgi:hypothetical protein
VNGTPTEFSFSLYLELLNGFNVDIANLILQPTVFASFMFFVGVGSKHEVTVDVGIVH